MKRNDLLFTFCILLGFKSYAADLNQNFKKRSFKNPLREVSVIVGDDGFYPSTITAFEGERLHFFITSSTKKSQCFVLQKHEVFVSAEFGMINETEVVLEYPGRYKFYCPSHKFEGHLTVLSKDKPEEQISRTVASEKPKYWTPRDYDE